MTGTYSKSIFKDKVIELMRNSSVVYVDGQFYKGDNQLEERLSFSTTARVNRTTNVRTDEARNNITNNVLL